MASTLLSAPLLHRTKSFWEARMMLPASPKADRPQQCNVCKRSFRFRLCISSVDDSGSLGGI